MNKERVQWIDALKGFAIISVVLGHAILAYLYSGEIPENPKMLLAVVSNFLYAFHMPLFFMISGYVFEIAYIEKEKDSKIRIKRQFLNIFIIYFMYSILYGVLKILSSSYVNNDIGLKDLIFIPIKPIEQYWYLYVLIEFYLLFIFDKIIRINPVILIAISGTASLLSGFLPTVSWFSVSYFLFNIFFFCIGMKFKWIKQNCNIKRFRYIFYLLIISVFVCAVYFLFKNEYIRTKPILNTIIALDISLIVWSLFQYKAKNPFISIFAPFGKYSLEIYLMHAFIISGVKSLMFKTQLNNYYICILICTFLAVFIPILFSLAAKKIGMHNLFFKPIHYLKKLKLE